METLKSVLTTIWEGLTLVPKTVWSFGLAFLFGFLLRGCIAVGLALALAGAAAADPPKVCPVNGANCTCGCLEGKTCNCAADQQRDAYAAMIAALKPGDVFYLFVGADADPRYANSVRWDGYPARWPGRWRLTGKIDADHKTDFYTAVSLDPEVPTADRTVKVDRPGWTQETRYYELVAGLKSGDEFDVFVNCDRESYLPWVRWDAYPGLTGKWHVRGKIGPDGKPYVSSSVSLDPKPVQRFTSFAGGGCAGGRCR